MHGLKLWLLLCSITDLRRVRRAFSILKKAVLWNKPLRSILQNRTIDPGLVEWRRLRCTSSQVLGELRLILKAPSLTNSKTPSPILRSLKFCQRAKHRWDQDS